MLTEEKLDLILQNQAHIARAIEEILIGLGKSEEGRAIWQDTVGPKSAQAQMGEVMSEVARTLAQS
jgi:hypothetical protein